MGFDEHYEEFKPISKSAFHINSIAALIGLLASSFMFCHSAYKYKKKSIPDGAPQNKNIPPKILCASLSVLLTSMFLFITYCIEYFWLRIFPPTSFNYSSYKFCNNFTPFLHISIWLLVYVIIHYFLIRLEHSFKGSALEYPQHLYIIVKSFTVLVIIIAIVLVIVATDGMPYSVDTQQVTNNDPWLCRNGILSDYKYFWSINNAVGLMVLLSGNFLNWYLFMNRLSKLVELGLTHDDSFKTFYSKKRYKKQASESLATRKYQSVENDANCEITPINMTPINKEDAQNGYPDTKDINTTHKPSGSMRLNSVFDRVRSNRKYTDQEKEERKRRRAARETRLYTMIKRQSILTGFVSISGAIFMLFQIFIDEGSTMLLLSVIVSVICVYLSFRFNMRCFDICCHRVMEDCTCIEDRMEKKVAQKLGLKQESMLEIVNENDK